MPNGTLFHTQPASPGAWVPFNRNHQAARELGPRVAPSDLSRMPAGVQHRGVNRSLAFIDQNFHRPIGLLEVVKASGMSRRGLLKAFNRHLGMAPASFLRQIRLKHAKRLLAEHNIRLCELARRCGYRSVNSFCVAFQREMRLAPKQYQRRYLLAHSFPYR